ncbi:MAG: D-amino-acid oxidase, partial [Gammaproteobacteria bacterium]|nr:D-amino-acid oxidase [Gammaproteobacteria bacterium]
MMDRRTLLKIGGLGLLGSGLGACGVRSTPMGRPPLRLAPVRVDPNRIIRTTVGLRPHRPAGFLLRAERL